MAWGAAGGSALALAACPPSVVGVVSPAPPRPGDEHGPQPFGPFLLLRRIAVGGTAEVFLARPRQGNRPAPQLVIKRLLREPGEHDRFAALSREADLNRVVKHPNVVEVFGAGMVGDEAYLALEYVEGVDLHRLTRTLASEGRVLPTGLAVHIAGRVASALHAVHTAKDEQGRLLNIRHGDVSPSNVYLSLSGEVKLGDFGLAHSAQAARGHDGVKGKFGYLAPEQLVRERVDHRADIFSLAVMLGEMLIGQRVFPGSGQLAVLLSIREANIGPLRRAAKGLPQGLFQVCARALERSPEARFPSAQELCSALAPFEEGERQRAQLSEFVRAARDSEALAQRLEQRALDSANVRRISSPLPPTSSVRRGEQLLFTQLPFAKLLELAATGQLVLDDEVSLMGAPFRRVEQIDELARHLLPSTTMTTGRLFAPGVPDYTAELAATPMLEILARMRMRRETGALFVSRFGSDGLPERKDLYLRAGRLVHAASSDPEELLGHYAVHLNLITQAELERALNKLRSFGGRLGDTLIGLGMVEPAALFRAIRNQGRDRVAALCSWREGQVQLYRGAEPGELQFPLDLELTVPMMAGAMRRDRQGGDGLATAKRVLPGRFLEQINSEKERAELPVSLQRLLCMVHVELSLQEILRALCAGDPEGRPVSEREARAALVAAAALQWVRFE